MIRKEEREFLFLKFVKIFKKKLLKIGKNKNKIINEKLCENSGKVSNQNIKRILISSTWGKKGRILIFKCFSLKFRRMQNP